MKSLFPVVAEALLVPPGACLLLGAAGLLALGLRRRRTGGILVASSLLLLWAASTPALARWLVGTLEGQAAAPASKPPGAIVVLGGGSYHGAPEYGGDTVGSLTLERVRYGARLARATGLPLLVTGGDPLGAGQSEASQMKAVLQLEFGVPVRWTEDRSRTTHENALATAALLRTRGVDSVRLVTHAWHMPRARLAFEAAGIAVHPAPTVFAVPPPRDAQALQWLPDAEALRGSRVALHEWLGIAWYRLQSATP